tara:strand:- start:189 stop:422 length:234 start_codon:yes stop_codon:yes gene_type:complete
MTQELLKLAKQLNTLARVHYKLKNGAYGFKYEGNSPQCLFIEILIYKWTYKILNILTPNKQNKLSKFKETIEESNCG